MKPELGRLLLLLIEFIVSIGTMSSSETTNALLTESLRSNLVQACDGEKITLHCPRNTQILVENAFYGTSMAMTNTDDDGNGNGVKDRLSCPFEDLREERDAMIYRQEKGAMIYQQEKEAMIYRQETFTTCEMPEALSIILDHCRSKRKCRISVKPFFFGRVDDPCPNMAKYLQISYKCKPVSFDDQIFCHNTSTKLNCKLGKRLAIYSAEYGRRRRMVNGQHCRHNNTPLSTDCIVNVLDRVLMKCHAQAECTLTIDDAHFHSNPCPFGVETDLSLVFMCVNDEIFSETAIKGNPEMINSMINKGSPEMINKDRQSFSSQQRFETMDSPVNDAAFIPPSPPSTGIEKKRPSPSRNDREDEEEESEIIPSRQDVRLLIELMAVVDFIRENRERCLLYFCLSVSTGLALLLIACILHQFCSMDKKKKNKKKQSTSGDSLKLFNSMIIASPMYSSTDQHGPEQMTTSTSLDMDDLTNGVSFMRFAQLTPPRRKMSSSLLYYNNNT